MILFARNITSGEQTHRLLKECQSGVSTRLFTCVDMEGAVDRFRNVIGAALGRRCVCRRQSHTLSQTWKTIASVAGQWDSIQTLRRLSIWL